MKQIKIKNRIYNKINNNMNNIVKNVNLKLQTNDMFRYGSRDALKKSFN